MVQMSSSAACNRLALSEVTYVAGNLMAFVHDRSAFLVFPRVRASTVRLSRTGHALERFVRVSPHQKESHAYAIGPAIMVISLFVYRNMTFGPSPVIIRLPAAPTNLLISEAIHEVARKAALCITVPLHPSLNTISELKATYLARLITIGNELNIVHNKTPIFEFVSLWALRVYFYTL